MAKNNDVSSVIQNMLGNPDQPKNSPQTPIQGRDSVQDKGTGESAKKAIETLRQHNFRMKQSEYERLQQHFESKGLAIGAGIRMILKEYMKRENV